MHTGVYLALKMFLIPNFLAELSFLWLAFVGLATFQGPKAEHEDGPPQVL